MAEHTQGPDHSRRRGGLWHLLLLIPFVALLWPPFYNRDEPRLFEMPFFYWYQLACVFLAAFLTAIVYLMTEKSR